MRQQASLIWGESENVCFKPLREARTKYFKRKGYMKQILLTQAWRQTEEALGEEMLYRQERMILWIMWLYGL